LQGPLLQRSRAPLLLPVRLLILPLALERYRM
jgi:hypothetical protein